MSRFMSKQTGERKHLCSVVTTDSSGDCSQKIIYSQCSKGAIIGPLHAPETHAWFHRLRFAYMLTVLYCIFMCIVTSVWNVNLQHACHTILTQLEFLVRILKKLVLVRRPSVVDQVSIRHTFPRNWQCLFLQTDRACMWCCNVLPYGGQLTSCPD